MRSKWYISALIFSITLLGAVFQQQATVPNQEIVLQFNDAHVSSEDVNLTIANVKEQLHALGINNIHVKSGAEGELKITYYSDIDITRVKQTFSKEKSLELQYTSYTESKESSKKPTDSDGINYELDVYEIHNGEDAEWDLEGTFVLEIESKSDRFFEPNVYTTVKGVDVRKETCISKISYKVWRQIALTIDETVHIIPEVRAGPTS